MLEANGTLHSFGDAPPPLTSPELTRPRPGHLTHDRHGPHPRRAGPDCGGHPRPIFSLGSGPYFGDVSSVVPGYGGHVVGLAATPG